jgi:N-acetylmuramoyl-L-alanine amidase
MKIIAKAVLPTLFLFCFGVVALSAPAPQTLTRKNVSVFLDGQSIDEIDTYQNSRSEYFFSIKDIARIYNASFEWKPISSVVTMRVNNKRLDFSPDNKTVLFGKDPRDMQSPSRLVGNVIYIPAEILSTKEFAQITDINTRWIPAQSRLALTYNLNVKSIEYIAKTTESQIIVEMSQAFEYTVSRSSRTVLLKILRGKAKNETIEINNGAIANIASKNDGRIAVISVNLVQDIKVVRATRSVVSPDKISLIIEHSKPIPASQTGTSAQEVKVDIPISPIEEGQDNTDLSNLTLEKFDVQSVRDESVAIVDDASSFTEMAALSAKNKNKNAKLIIIDAGHGGNDPGAVGPGGTKEKDIALEIAYELKRLFDRNKDYTVVLTRKDDAFIPLAERTNIANEQRGDLFISIHCNANINRKIGGFEVFLLSERASDAEALATANLENSVIELEGKPSPQLARIQRMLWSMMQNEYLNESAELSSFIAAVAPGRLKIQNRGVKQAGFYVLRGTQMPAVLVEVAFISNYSEEARLKDRRFQQSAAQSIYDGVLRYYDRKNMQQRK